MKVVCVFCLSCSCLPNHNVPYHCTFGTIGKPLMRKVHFGFTMFQITMQKLLDVEQFCQKKFNKIKAQNLMKIWRTL